MPSCGRTLRVQDGGRPTIHIMVPSVCKVNRWSSGSVCSSDQARETTPGTSSGGDFADDGVLSAVVTGHEDCPLLAIRPAGGFEALLEALPPTGVERSMDC